MITNNNKNNKKINQNDVIVQVVLCVCVCVVWVCGKNIGDWKENGWIRRDECTRFFSINFILNGEKI